MESLYTGICVLNFFAKSVNQPPSSFEEKFQNVLRILIFSISLRKNNSFEINMFKKEDNHLNHAIVD